jgi:hypothetical protein
LLAASESYQPARGYAANIIPAQAAYRTALSESSLSELLLNGAAESGAKALIVVVTSVTW